MTITVGRWTFYLTTVGLTLWLFPRDLWAFGLANAVLIAVLFLEPKKGDA